MPEAMTCQVIRVTRPDTILIRTYSAPVQANVHVHLVLEGVRCKRAARQEILDWVEVHADAERLSLVTWEWFRDSYGRVLGDLADRQTGETLTQWLIDRGVAKSRPDHYLEILRSMVASEEPDQC
jgi:endonuclease YncB( thermonuclease family)